MFKRAVAVASCLAAVASAADHIQTKLREGVVMSRAVNLGGWFVSEYWMCYNSPLYKGVPPEEGIKGEYGVMKYLGKEQGTKNFENHWSTWITEKDIKEIAEAGLNTVRVSTGFWIINDEDDSDKTEITNTYPRGGLKYLDTLVNDWAVKYNIAVMVSLHAHRGSQNGNDHSAPVKLGDKLWAKDPVNVESSFKFATFIANRYKNSIAFLGLNLMNEPVWGQDYEVLWKYYKDAYKAIRADGNNCIIGTSPWLQEQGVGTMQDFMPCPEYYNVWHEFHVYYKWGWEGKPLSDVFAEASTYAATHFTPWTGNPIYLGEWSLGTADEDKRTDAELKEFASIQMKEAEQAQAGWAFWAWHHDDESKMTSGWSMRQLLRKGIMTVPKGELKRTPNPKCPKVESTYSDSTSLSSGSGSNGPDSVSLFVPEKVKAGNTDGNTTAMPSANSTAKTNATNTTTNQSAAAQPAGVLGAVVLTAVSTLLALTAL